MVTDKRGPNAVPADAVRVFVVLSAYGDLGEVTARVGEYVVVRVGRNDFCGRHASRGAIR